MARQLFSSLDDLQCTEAFMHTTGVSICMIKKKKKERKNGNIKEYKHVRIVILDMMAAEPIKEKGSFYFIT